MRSMHVCIYGVRLGDSQSADIKNINNIIAFKPKQKKIYFINTLLWIAVYNFLFNVITSVTYFKIITLRMYIICNYVL